jgi:hypothetical protein
MMKIRTLFESIIQESYRDFKRIAEPAFIDWYMKRNPDANEDTLRLIFQKRLESFREGANRNILDPIERDISHWVRKIRVDPDKGIPEFLQRTSEIDERIADRTPEYYVIHDGFPFTIIKLENHAAAEKLCGNMNICIRKKDDFKSYIDGADLYFIKDLEGQKFILHQGQHMDVYDLWTKDNVEISAEEFLDYSNARVTQQIINDIVSKDPQLQYFLFDLQDAQMEEY